MASQTATLFDHATSDQDARPSSGAPAMQYGRPKWRFAGLTVFQLLAILLCLGATVWCMWATREIMALGDRKTVSVRLSAMVNEFVMEQARASASPEQITANTQVYMRALETALKARSDKGQTILVAEAVVSSSVEDITEQVRGEVAAVFKQLPASRAAPAPLGYQDSRSAPPQASGVDPRGPRPVIQEGPMPGAQIPAPSPFGGAPVDANGN